MLHEMSEAMEERLRVLADRFEGEFTTLLEEAVETLEEQVPVGEDGESVDPQWAGTWDEESLEDKIAYLRDALDYLTNAARAITDACEA